MNKKKIQKEKVTLKNTASNLVIVLLLATIIVSAVIGLYAWAKYRSAIDGSAEAEVAKWHFELQKGTTDSGKTLLALTRTDENTTVAKEKVAPGTYGELPIIIDTTKTEVSLVYDLEVKITNYPQNMILQNLEGQVITPVVSGDGTGENPRVATITVSKYVPYNIEDSNRLHDETITWNWPYETGTEDCEINANDQIDTQDAGKEIFVSISVTGTQVLQEPEQGERLADVVSVGDYVNYNAASGNGAEKSYTTDKNITGHSTSTTFSSADSMTWRVLSVNTETGIVELMSADPTPNDLYIGGTTAYINVEDVLNDIGAIYGQGKGATGGRSIKLEDVDQYSSYDPTTYTNSTNVKYGDIKEQIYDDCWYDIGDGSITGGTVTSTYANGATRRSASSSNPVTAKQTYYGYTALEYFENQTVYKMLFRNEADTSDKSYWLASRYLDIDRPHVYSGVLYWFGVRSVWSGKVIGSRLDVNGGMVGDGENSGIVPVVSLKSNIQTSGQDESGAWNLIIEQN